MPAADAQFVHQPGGAMTDGKTPLYLTVVVLVLIGAAVLVVQPYSADFPGTEYAQPARRYLRVALRPDSTALRAVSGSHAAVAWALGVARAHPDALAAWAGPTHTYVTARRADTAEVLVYPEAEPCRTMPITLTFIGTPGHARVVNASSTCLQR
jgi:hypothetical protein